MDGLRDERFGDVKDIGRHAHRQAVIDARRERGDRSRDGASDEQRRVVLIALSAKAFRSLSSPRSGIRFAPA